MISHPYHHTTDWFLSFACVYFILYGAGLQHMEIHPAAKKIRAKWGSNPWSQAPTDHTQTTTPLAQFWFWLVWYFLYMLIDVFCGHLISHKKRGDSGGIRTRDTRPHIRAPYHGTTYVIWFWIPCFFFIASMTARLVTRTPRGKFGKKLRQKGGFEPWSQGRDSDALPLPC
jgi:hypothetical protein